MLSVEQRMELRDLMSNDNPVVASAAKEALAADMAAQRVARDERRREWMEDFIPSNEREAVAYARALKTGMDYMNAHVPRGWNDRVDKLIDAIYAVDEGAVLSQVKAKFGGFRCYGTFNEAAQLLVTQCELDLMHVCWWCGAVANDRFRMEPACNDHKDGFKPRAGQDD